MPSKEWLEKYEAAKEKLRCKKDLDAYFTEKEIGGTPIDTLEIGSVSFPTGEVIACDPLVDLDGARPYIQTCWQISGRYMRRAERKIRRPLRLRQGRGQRRKTRALRARPMRRRRA